jgi:hypothetical protein
VNVNLSRAVGPALAGLVIAHLGGVPVVFGLNAVSVVFLAIALLIWRRPQPRAERTDRPEILRLRHTPLRTTEWVGSAQDDVGIGPSPEDAEGRIWQMDHLAAGRRDDRQDDL